MAYKSNLYGYINGKAHGVPERYRIKFVDYNGTVLQDSLIISGRIPVYAGETPERPMNEEQKIRYDFSGWDSAISEVTEDKIYTAQYAESPAVIVRFMKPSSYGSDIFEILQASYWKVGDTPVYSGETPSIPISNEFKYTFDGWDKEITQITSTEDINYTAVINQEYREFTVACLIPNSGSTSLKDDGTFNGYTTHVYSIHLKWRDNISYEDILPFIEQSYTSGNGIKFTLKEPLEIHWGIENGNVRISWDLCNPGGAVMTDPWSPSTSGYDAPAEDDRQNKTYDILPVYDYASRQVVQFKNYDGTILQDSVRYRGQTPEYTGATPGREYTGEEEKRYKFIGWDKEIATIADEVSDDPVVYTAQYELVDFIIALTSGTTEVIYTGEDEFYKAPSNGTLTIKAYGAGSNTAAGGYAEGTISVNAGDRISVMVGQSGSTTSSTTYGFGGSANYGSDRAGGGLSGVFTGIETITETSASRALVIGGGAGGGCPTNGRNGGMGGGEEGQNGQGSNYGTAGGGGTQTGRNSGGNVGANQFNGGNGSGTYGYGGGGGWYGGNSSIGDSSADDDKGAGGGSGYVISTASNRVLTQGGGAAAGSNGKVILIYTPNE